MWTNSTAAQPIRAGFAAGRGGEPDGDAELAAALERLVDPDARGDPVRRCGGTIRVDAAAVGGADRSGAPVQRMAGAATVHDAGYSLQAAARYRGHPHPDRDARSAMSTTTCASIIRRGSR